MAFAANARVKISDEHSQYRGLYGTVIDVLAGSKYNVRPDGFPTLQTVLLAEASLSGTSLPDPITYPS